MIVDLQQQNATAIYHLMTQTLIPRPVAWVLSEHELGHFNLAPFSYFTAVSSAPPLLMFSVGNKSQNVGKDTKVNIAKNPYFVVHIAPQSLAREVTETSRTLPAEQSELTDLGLATVPFEGFPLPRLESCAIAFGCKLHALQDVPGAPQTLVFGEIERIFIDDRVSDIQRKQKSNSDVSERIIVDALKVQPLARLGADQYGCLGSILEISRPK